MKSVGQLLVLLAGTALALFWLWMIVTQLPLLLTAGGLGYFAGVALVVLSVIVPAFMAWKIFKAKTNTTIKE